jgi:hypothetical protein
MSELKCEFPEGCRLDLFAKVVKAKYIARQVKVLEDFVCVPLFSRNRLRVRHSVFFRARRHAPIRPLCQCD